MGEDVPICILHPAEDEVIPPEHGSSVLENAACRSRLGIWLRGATHNFILQEEHLERVGEFLGTHFKLNGPEGAFGHYELGYEHGDEPPKRNMDGDDPDEADRQDIIGRLVWWSVSGRAELLRQS